MLLLLLQNEEIRTFLCFSLIFFLYIWILLENYCRGPLLSNT